MTECQSTAPAPRPWGTWPGLSHVRRRACSCRVGGCSWCWYPLPLAGPSARHHIGPHPPIPPSSGPGDQPVQTQAPGHYTGGTSALEVRVDRWSSPPPHCRGGAAGDRAGCSVRTNLPGAGGDSVRGPNPEQVAILYDGIPLTWTYDARTDVSVPPAAALRENSSCRGLSHPALQRTQRRLGGVVEMNSRNGAAESPRPQGWRLRGGGIIGGDTSTAAPHTTSSLHHPRDGGWSGPRLGFRTVPGRPSKGT